MTIHLFCRRYLTEQITAAPAHLIIDGAALVSGLNVYGNTIIELECINGGGLYLKDGSSRSVIRQCASITRRNPG